jgi:acyl-CoA synthetase (AMP-forming)/AMP-acid ligase II
MNDTDLIDLLGRASARPSLARFVTSRGARETSFGELWSMSTRAASAIERSAPGSPIAGLMTPSPEMIACFVGCLRAGRDFVSMPMRGRGQSAEAHLSQIRTILDLSGAAEVIVEAASASIFAASPELPQRLRVAEALVESGDESLRPPDHAPGALVQFSSGTTGAPKGVRVNTSAIGVSVQATLDALDARPGDVSCLFAPLSHDMGLIGGLLGSWVLPLHTGSASSRYVCLSPELFLVRPAVWMETCASHRATITAAPTFAYQLVARQLDRVSTLDLRSLRACIVGAEPIGADTLRQFALAARRHGFDERALCPAYGLAEATLAVTLVRPVEPWSTATIDVEGRRTEVVSCGRAIGSMEVRAPERERGPGSILVRGTSVCDGFVPPLDRWVDGWLDTGDRGALAGGELLVTGRSDDMLCVAGRNLFAWELEQEAARCSGVRPGSCVAVPDGQGRYVVLFEALGAVTPHDVVVEVRRRLANLAGVGPSGVGCLRTGEVPRTPSGKIRRNSVRAALHSYVDVCLSFQEF